MKTLWEGWKKLARHIGNFQARVVLTVFYILLVAPIGFIIRLASDPLRTKAQGDSFWIARENPELSPSEMLEHARRQG